MTDLARKEIGMICENCGCDVPDASVWQKYCRPCGIAVAAENKRQRNREAQAAKNAATRAIFSEAQQALDELHAETERARAARFGTKRFTSLAATPEIPAGNADRGDQLTGAAGACNHGVGIGLIGVGI